MTARPTYFCARLGSPNMLLHRVLGRLQIFFLFNLVPALEG
jgi:hypothetical protein